MGNLRNKMGRYVFLTCLLVLLVAAADIRPVQAAVKLNTSSVNLCVGDKYQLKLTGTTKKVTWKSSKTAVAKVSSKGLVTAKGKGSATITATVSKKSYSCKVKVNKDFKVDKTSLSIKKETDITVFLSVPGGSVYPKDIKDQSVCSVEFRKDWIGNYLAITIVPKKVGSTEILLVSRKKKDPAAEKPTYVDLESCTLKVKVTALPSIATFQNTAISTGADTLTVDENKLSVPFSLNLSSKKTYLKFYDENGAIVRSISLGEIKAKKKKTVTWDGKDDDGNPLNGTFSYAVVADGNRTDGKGTVKVLSASPFGKGDGTKNNPYLVSDMNEFDLMRSYNGAHFAQDADIDFNYEPVRQLFDSTDPFSGTFDGSYGGKKYRILNVCGYNSLFGTIGTEGTVRNVSMSNCVLNTIGSLLAFTNKGTVEKCTVDMMSKILCNAGNQAAMLVMYNEGMIRDCQVYGSLNVKASNVVGITTLKAGGVVFQNSGTIAICTSGVQIVQELAVGTYVPGVVHEIYSGGIAAENISGAFVRECHFTGSVTTNVILPDTVKDVSPMQTYRAYTGFMAGTNGGYIVGCSNASMNNALGAQGMVTGSGTVQ